jgi:hypothetical protein
MSSASRAGRSLSPIIPLGYLGCAAVAFVVGAVGVAWLAPELASHYYHPRVLALAHTVTLGWVTLAIMGAGYQIMPIALERPVWSERLARWQLAILVVAISGMVAHFYLGTWSGLAAAACLVAVGIALHMVNVSLSLRGFTQWTFSARMVMLAYGGLTLTALFGVSLATNRVWPFLPGQFFPTLHAHVQLGLLGWVTPMIFGVAARVYPMFLLAPTPRRSTCHLQMWGLIVGVPSVVLGLLLGVSGLLLFGALAIAAATLGHVALVVEMMHRRKRPVLDWGLRFTVTATVFLLAAAGLGLALALDVLSGPRAALAYAVVALGGFVSLTIVGMMLKIVPFLVWYHTYGPRAGREQVPTLVQISAPRLEGLAYALLVGGMFLLAVSVFVGDAGSIRVAGSVIALGALAFAAALAQIMRHLSSARAAGPWFSRSNPGVPAGEVSESRVR